MANVRDYLKKRKERKEGQTRISYREKIRSHKFMIFYRTVLVILLAVGVSAALYIQWKNKYGGFFDGSTDCTGCHADAFCRTPSHLQ